MEPQNKFLKIKNISKRIARGALVLSTEHIENLWSKERILGWPYLRLDQN